MRPYVEGGRRGLNEALAGRAFGGLIPAVEDEDEGEETDEHAAEFHDGGAEELILGGVEIGDQAGGVFVGRVEDVGREGEEGEEGGHEQGHAHEVEHLHRVFGGRELAAGA